MAPGSSRSARRRALVCWILFLMACGAFALARHRLEIQRQADAAQWSKYESLRYRVGIYYDSPLEDVLFNLAPGKPLPEKTVTPSGAFRATMPGSSIDPQFNGWEVLLGFSPPQRWAEGRPVLDKVVVVPPLPLRSGPTALWRAIEHTRVGILWFAMLIWFTGFGLVVIVRPIRRRVAPICLMSALACVLAASLDLEFGWASVLKPWKSTYWLGVAPYNYSLRDVIATHPAFFDAGIVAAMIALLLLVIPSRQIKSSQCVQCNYDLTGNMSGICPECGAETPRHKRQHRLAEYAPIADQLNSVIVSD